VPTHGLYPFQWNWDSAFCAMGFATFDEARGWDELDHLFLGQWADGLVPHIVFHQPADSYFPGPEVWGVSHAPPTSGITQPPVAAIAARWMLDTAADADLAEARCAALFPRLAAWHRWWTAARDRDGTGLSAILHPWESGMDNSTAWDGPLARVPRTANPYARKDLGHVDAAMRPRQEDYDRYVHLVETYRACGWEPGGMWAAAPFKVAHVGVNAILQRADMDLAALAERFGDAAERRAIAARIDRRQKALSQLWSDGQGAYLSHDLISGALIEAPTNAGFLPLLAREPDQRRVAAMASQIARWRGLGRFGCPTVAPDDPLFEARRYWRGPIWAVVNALLIDGLARHGQGALAAALTADLRGLMLEHGFAEYFDPRDGAPCGGANFSWTAAVGLSLALRD
jgi:glycogen debranching enzyme